MLSESSIYSGVYGYSSKISQFLTSINPSGYQENCGECSILVDTCLSGVKVQPAANSQAIPLATIQRLTGGQFLYGQTWQSGVTLITPGARGIIFGHQGDPTNGHFWNAFNDGQGVVYVDGQAGGPLKNSGDYTDGELAILLTYLPPTPPPPIFWGFSVQDASGSPAN